MKKLGHAFSEEVIKASRKTSFHKVEDLDWEENLISGIDPSTSLLSPWRKVVLLSLLLVSFFGIFLRMFHLQIVSGKDYRSLADSNRIKIKVIHAPRGVIYDRGGKILAQNEPGFRLLETDASSSVHSRLISRDEALKMEVSHDPKFKDLEIDNLRSYPMGEMTAHILGYISQINPKELESLKTNGYKTGDLIGRGGVEQVYESSLRGVDGGEIIEVDANGNKIRSLFTTDPIPGENLYLTIDADLERVVYQNLFDAIKKSSSCCGAAVVEDPISGQILAMVSIPSYDPTNIEAALSGLNSPLLNRAIAGTYPPGSTFKIVSSLAGLSSGKITPQTSFTDTGVINLGPYTFSNWYFTQYGRTEEGPVDIVRAIQRSNDIFFYHLGEQVGEEKLAQTARNLGLGNILGVDLPAEAAGLVADDAWKQTNLGEVWFPGDTLHTAIGQGFTLVTPLQDLNLISTIAAEGKSYPPHLALKITSPSGSAVKQFKYDPSVSVFKKDQIDLVKKGLSEVPKYGGTAWPFFTFPIPTAGKTGTAEYGDIHDRTHAWYVSFAPYDNPKLAMVALVEGGGEGSNVSAPVVKEVYRWYFSKDKNNLIKDTYIVATQSGKLEGE